MEDTTDVDPLACDRLLADKRELLAAYAHEAWSGWMSYLFSKSTRNTDGSVTIPRWAVERWSRQASTKYALLPEEEKQSDRDEADRLLTVIDGG